MNPMHLALILVIVLVGGCRSATLSRAGAMSEGYEQQQRGEQPASYSAPPSRSTLDSSSGCYSDYDCAAGVRCVRPGGYGAGVCGRAVDSYGTPTYGRDNRGVGCTLNTDCPQGFECSKPGGRYDGVCTKRY